MKMCEKCGAECNNLYRGYNLYRKIEGSDPNTPYGRGYYLICSNCKKAEDRGDAAFATGIYLVLFRLLWKLIKFFYPLLCFLIPGALLYYYTYNAVAGIVTCIAGTLAFLVISFRRNYLLKKADIIMLITSGVLFVVLHFIYK